MGFRAMGDKPPGGVLFRLRTLGHLGHFAILKATEVIGHVGDEAKWTDLVHLLIRKAPSFLYGVKPEGQRLKISTARSDPMVPRCPFGPLRPFGGPHPAYPTAPPHGTIDHLNTGLVTVFTNIPSGI